MLTQVCQYLRNWFERTKYIGDFTITNGELTYGDGSTLPLLTGQYYRIVGSILNDGVHQMGEEEPLKDESFTGAVWSMAVPPDLVELADDIDKWSRANAAAINSPYQSESFGGYSYSMRDSASSGGQSAGISWQSQFAARLAPWRKI